MVKEVESGVVDGYFFLEEGVGGILVDQLQHFRCHLGVEEQVGFCDGLLPEPLVVFVFPCFGAGDIDEYGKHQQQSGEQEGKQISEFAANGHMLVPSLKMKPMPLLVWINFTGNSLSIFFRK